MIQIPERELVNISELKVDGDNPNRMTPHQHKRLKTSIEKYGFIVPIITNKDLLIADGEQRLTVAQSLKMKQVPIIRLPVEDVDRRLLRQVLNKLRGEHELLLDAQEFERIIEAGGEDDLKHLLDLTDSSLEKYLSEIREDKDESYEIPEIDKIVTNVTRGDIYKLGNHRLMCGDATQKDDVSALMNGNKADMVFTDPPYNVGLRYGQYEDAQLFTEYYKLIENSLRLIHNNIQSGSGIYFMSGEKYRFYVEELFRKIFHFHQLLLWVKESGTSARGDYTFNYEAVLYGWKRGEAHRFYNANIKAAELFNRPLGKEREPHPAQRPVSLVGKYIENSSLKNEIVLDVFGGSGSTLIACEQTGRRCYMMEIDPRYCQVIVDRWEAYTGQKAEKLPNSNK